MYLLLAAVLGLAVILFYKTKFSKSKAEDLVFPLDYSIGLKGFFSVLIVLHHFSSLVTSEGILENCFYNAGYVCVSGFFVISGWGTAWEFHNKKDYMIRFWKNKIFSIVIPLLEATVIYLAAKLSKGDTLSDICSEFLRGAPIVLFSWYFISVLILYFNYYVCFKNGKLNIIIFIFSGILYFVIFKFLLRWPEHWYGTFWSFYISALIYEFKRFQNYIVKRKYVLFLSIIVFIITFAAYNTNDELNFLIEFISVVSISFVILISGNYVDFSRNAVLRFLSDISLYTYLYHGLILILLSLWNIPLYIGIVLMLGLSISLSYAACKLNNVFFKSIKIFKEVR